MQFLRHQPEPDTQWQTYKKLELIPDSLNHTGLNRSEFTFGLGWVWKQFISSLIAEVEAEERVKEYLDRCWASSNLEDPIAPAPSSLAKLWALMD